VGKVHPELENLPNRCFYAKHKIEGGVLPLRTAEVLPAYEEFGIEREEFEEIMKGVVFGRKYLLERKPKAVERKRGKSRLKRKRKK